MEENTSRMTSEEEIKRSNSPMTNDVPSTKNPKSTEQGSCNDKSNCRNEIVKMSTMTEISTSQMSCPMETPVSNASENSTIQREFKSILMKKRSKNFEAHLQLLREKFGNLRIKKVGIFLKLFTDNNEMHRQVISFLTLNNIEYLKPKKGKWIRVVIKGLPCDMGIQQIKEALIEKDVDVENIVQMMDYRTKKSLPLFKAILPKSVRNKRIFNLTELLNLKVSVERFVESRFRRFASHEKGAATPEADVLYCVDGGATGKIVKFRGHKKFRQGRKSNAARVKIRRSLKRFEKALSMLRFSIFLMLLNIFSFYKTSHPYSAYQPVHITMVQAKTSRDSKGYQKELPRMNNNMNASESSIDFQDTVYARKEFRKLLEKYNDTKTFDQQSGKAKNAIENSRSFLLFPLFKFSTPAQSNECQLLHENCTPQQQKKRKLMSSNIDESDPSIDLQDIIYIMKEFRKIFEKFNIAKNVDQLLRKSKNRSVLLRKSKNAVENMDPSDSYPFDFP